MRASLDTNVIIHFYKANLQNILFDFFDEGVFIYEQIRNVELENHGQDVISKVDSDIAAGRIEIYTNQKLKDLQVYKIFEHNVNENRNLYGSGDLGEVYAISLAQTLLLCICTIFLAGSTDPLSGICSVQSKVTCHAWRNRLMLKVRLMGTKNDIAWFQKILQRHPKIEVMELSELYSNKGTSKYYRAYAEIEKSNVNKK